jgi:mitogen-activated protein kinase kinase kinase 5
MAKDIKVISCFQDGIEGVAAEKALQEACNHLGIIHSTVNFDKLDFGETSAIDVFYSADVVVADVTEISRRNSLFYHLAIRESLESKNNIVTMVNTSESYRGARRGSVVKSPNDLAHLQSMVASTSYVLVVYYINEEGKPCVWNTQPTASGLNLATPDKELVKKFQRLLNDVQVAQRQQIKELFFKELRQAREKFAGDELKAELVKLQRMLDQNPTKLFHTDVILNLLLSFRDVQDYQSMVSLVEKLPQGHEVTQKAPIQYHYAFALNRRNKDGDRGKALDVLEKILASPENQVPDFICLCGRIYKDKFAESDYKNKDFLKRSIHWYRKGFEIQPNEYAGINLATLLVISGDTFSKSAELQRIGMTLNTLIGRKGNLESQQDYWVVATYFEISVLAENYTKAIVAAECMFKLHPPPWYVKSTVNNIKLIASIRKKKKKQKEKISLEERKYNYWIEFFMEGIKEEVEMATQYPVLVLDPDSKRLLPCYMAVQGSDDHSEPSIEIWNIASVEEERERHQWKFPISSIRNVAVLKRDARCILLFSLHFYGQEFNISFPSEQLRQLFMDFVQLNAGGTEQDSLVPTEMESIQYEYLYEKGERVVLGRGSFGVVYSALDKVTKKLLAVKEIPEREKDSSEFQALQEEIRLHSHFQHKNIVRYYDARSEGGYFKIFMEQVPGGSLSSLLRDSWGPLDEAAIKYYTRQIVKGLKYLHDSKIVHRDIKGDNILVNTYDGKVKIGDFGTSQRLAGLHDESMSFKGTIQFMAPEVIAVGQRGYGPPADIWSLGCTVIEMATGKPPFYELANIQAAMFQVGRHKRHPDIPPTLSADAHNFLKSCFNPDPEKRATANDLLIHPFLGADVATVHDTPPEYQRSVSVPVKQPRPNLLDELSGKAITPSDVRRSSRTLNDSDRLAISHGPLDFGRTERDGLSPSPSLSTTLNSSSSDLSRLRSHTNNTLVLTQILTTKKDQICRDLCEKVFEYLSGREHEGVLEEAHLEPILQATAEYCKHDDLSRMDPLLDDLKKLCSENMELQDEVKQALYHFQTVITEALKRHGTQPHSIFTIGDIVRQAVHHALDILAPMSGPPAQTGTSSSHESAKDVVDRVEMDSPHYQLLRQKMQQLTEENMSLMDSLIQTKQEYNELIRNDIHDLRLRVKDVRTSNMPMVTLVTSHTGSSSTTESEKGTLDASLVEWLDKCNVPYEEQQKLLAEQITLNDLLNNIERQDLADAGLK